MLNADLYEEMIFRITGEPLGTSHPTSSVTLNKTISTAVYNDSTSWDIVLTREQQNLKIELQWMNGYDSYTYNRRNTMHPRFLSMNVVHHKRGIIGTLIKSQNSHGNQFKLTIPVDKAMRGRVYDFEIVLTTQPTLTRTFNMHLSDGTTNEDEVDESAAIKAGPSQAIMKTLLADRHSVDVQFIFTSDKTCSNVGFWAHRSVLSRYTALGDLIKKTLMEQLARDDDVGPLTVRMDKFSLATFACLVYYLYTGTIKRAMNITQFAFSQQDEAVVIIKDETTGRTKDRMVWNPLDAKSSWKLKDVTWTDLLFISEYFGVKDLRDECLHEVVESIKETNVVELLFEVGCFFEKVKDVGLEFLADNMESMCDKGKDPFAKYHDHKECHTMMLDAMRYKSIPASRRKLPLTSSVRSLAIKN
ncbi:hypothetical protein BGZ95_005514 [Linnemannia exigua]|uniref:BTB domain-containing protein n=1 Tax=Linnemannia exigua TaxID=604196 RepID=A0AAD4DGW4_9FUNG|nr:hypothetical protein BGZ95_005514 [Linnemannia exigua]